MQPRINVHLMLLLDHILFEEFEEFLIQLIFSNDYHFLKCIYILDGKSQLDFQS